MLAELPKHYNRKCYASACRVVITERWYNQVIAGFKPEQQSGTLAIQPLDLACVCLNVFVYMIKVKGVC